LCEAFKNRIRDRAGGGFDEAITPAAEYAAHGLDHLVVGHRVRELVRARGRREIDVEREVKLERLPDLGFVLHDAVVGVQRKPGNEDAVAHRAPRSAASTLRACTVSATSWVRTIAAPLATAIRWLANEPPRRRSGGAGDIWLMKRLREAPTSSGRPNDFSS